jgi:cytochrome c biogenesis protein CcmG/thiol:disulfide interchange protein DsbE
VNQKISIRAIGMLAFLSVSLFLYGCSPSASPQTNLEAQVIQALPQEDAIQGSAPEIAPQAQIPPLEAQADLVKEPTAPEAQAEPAAKLAQPETGGVGGGLSEGQSSAQSDPAPQPETGAEAPPPAPQAALSVSNIEPAIGSLAPEFSLQTLDGQSVQLSELRGKNLLISYWVTWCIPCIEELPVLNRLYQEYQSEDLVILSVNGIQQDELDKVTATISEMGITLPVALDQSEILWDSYWVRFLPTSFFIDETGIIRYIQLGSLTEENLRIKIEELISDQL